MVKKQNRTLLLSERPLVNQFKICLKNIKNYELIDNHIMQEESSPVRADIYTKNFTYHLEAGTDSDCIFPVLKGCNGQSLVCISAMEGP